MTTVEINAVESTVTVENVTCITICYPGGREYTTFTSMDGTITMYDVERWEMITRSHLKVVPVE
jgi:hypothetical protein